MAIKGKGKTRARQVARAPKRAPVEVPKPVYQRTWVQLVAAVLLGAFAVMLVVWVTNSLRESSRESDDAAARELRQDALSTIRTEFEAQIGAVGQIQDPLGPVIAPKVREAADALAKGNPPKVDAEELEQLSEDLAAAAAALEGFDLAATIRDQGFESAAQSEVLISSRAQLVAALRDVEQAASIVLLAIGSEDAASAEALGASALALVDSADAQAQNAWRTYRNALVEAGLVESLDGVTTAP
jgi:hypothetical protein